MTTSYQKFKLLVWKNFKIQSRHKKQTIFEILLPILLTVILVLIRSEINPSDRDPTTYTEFNSSCTPENDYRNNFTRYLAYSPANHTKINEIVELALVSINQLPFKRKLELKSLENSEKLDNFLVLNNPFVALEFKDDFDGNFKKLEYSIRLRGDDESRNWNTDKLQEINKMSRAPSAEGSYNSGCFLSIQNAVDSAFMKIIESSQPSLIGNKKVMLKRFPHGSYIEDPAFQFANAVFPLFIVFSFMYTVRNMIKDIALEKEKQLKETLKIIGLPNHLHWLAWFVKSLLYLLISLSVIAFLLTSPYVTSNKIAVLPNTNPFLLWLFLLIYSFAFISFCFLLSLPFKKATTCAAVGYMCWILVYLPFPNLSNSFYGFSYFTKLLICMLVNSGMGFGMSTILKLEINGVGLHWHNLFSRFNENQFSMGDVMLGLILGSILMLLLTLYFEKVFPGKYGIPRKWYFPIEGCVNRCFNSKYNALRESIGDENKKVGDTYEDEPKDKPAGIKIRSLTKIFPGKKVAVSKLYLNMFEDQITVLLGHNGAGKTTTMSMLTGLFPPSSGTAFIDGKDIRTDIDSVRESLGLCPQHNVLFDELTVEEHIIFFSRLKGLSANEVKEEVKKYVTVLELQPKLKAQSHTLSGGMKRKLSIALALCGKSKIVMLDEPSSGMDPAARRKLWDLLIEEKHGRTILLSTHFMDEADVLGDRIAVMAEGDLKAVGSSFFLKKRFGVGYRLVCVKAAKCIPNKVTEFLRSFIPEIKIETDIGTELTYILNESHISKFQKMFEKLENTSDELGVSSYGVSLTTMEEVFLKIGVDAHVLERRRNSIDSTSEITDSNGHRIDVESGGENGFEYLTGTPLLINQFIAMLKKRFNFTLRNYKTGVWNLFFTIFAIVISLRTSGGKYSFPGRTMNLEDYSKSVTAIQAISPDPIFDHYKSNIQEFSSIVEVPGNEDMDDFILQKFSESFDAVNGHYVVGMTVESDKIVGWYNGEFFHSLPLSLNLINRAILKLKMGDEYDITVTNKPFYYPDENSQDKAQILEMMKSVVLIILLTLVFTNWTSVFISFYIKERVSRAKLLQIISGANKTVFWLSSYLFDFLIMICVSLLVILTIAIFQKEGYSTFEELFRLFLIFAMFSFASLPMVYLFSHMFDQGSTGESMNTLLGVVSGLILFGVYTALSNIPGTTGDIFKHLYWLFLLSPHFILCDVLAKLVILNGKNTIFRSGMTNKLLSIEDLCKLEPEACASYWDFKDGISGDLLAFLVVGLLYLILLLFKEYHFFHQLFYKLRPPKSLPQLSNNIDSDVSSEIEKINQMSPNDIAEKNLVMRNLTKYYGNFLAVRRVCVSVSESSCFGLLGANGAGKTSVFKMLTGDEIISGGDAYVNHLSIKNELNKVHKKIGYCPQFDALLEDLTGNETMEIFCLLRGIPRSQIQKVTENLSTKLNFDTHLKKQIKAYSGGNKRKLSTALSLVGDPQVIFLDEPTTGMDPGAKRQLWDVIINMRSHGKSVILTSHSMEECEALCTRLAIMVNGEFKCLGSTQHLKNKFSKGFILSIKAGKADESELANHLLRIKEFVGLKFPDAVLKEEYLDILTYQIENSNLKWSQMFGLMESEKENLQIDDYSLGQTSLEQVFLFFTRNAVYSNA